MATGAAIAFLIDVSRLSIYMSQILTHRENLDYTLLGAAVVAAFSGAYIGNQYLKKITMKSVQTTVAVLLFCVALGLVSGLL